MILAFYGASGLGMECSSLAERINKIENRWTQFVFIDDNPSKTGDLLLGYPIMTFDQLLEKYKKDDLEFMVAIGEVATKKAIYEKLKNCGCKLTNLINPESSVHWSVQMGEGVMIGRNAAIGPKVVIGNNVLIRGNTVLGHDSVLEDNVEVCAFSVVGGKTVVKNNSFVGLHCCLRECIEIGENAIVGMGSVVTKSVPDNAVVYGNPAKVVRYNDTGKIFKNS